MNVWKADPGPPNERIESGPPGPIFNKLGHNFLLFAEKREGGGRFRMNVWGAGHELPNERLESGPFGPIFGKFGHSLPFFRRKKGGDLLHMNVNGATRDH